MPLTSHPTTHPVKPKTETPRPNNPSMSDLASGIAVLLVMDGDESVATTVYTMNDT